MPPLPSRAISSLAFLLPMLLVACPDGNGPKPTAAITSPANDASVSSTTPVQITALDETGVTKVQLYARSRGGTVKGVLVGSAVSKPFVLPWNTANVPNQAELELYTVATNTAGTEGASDPVRVKTANAGLPSLSYLAAFTYPPQPAASVSSQGLLNQSVSGLSARTLHLDPSSIKAPTGVNLETAALESARALSSLHRAPITASASGPRRQDLGSRTYALEWAWDPFNNADGYGIYFSKTDLAGPYERQINQSSSTAGTQKYSQTLTDATPGSTYYGLVTAITNTQTLETGYSNAAKSAFLPAQDSATPADGATVSDGKPTLTWTGTPGAVGYLYFVYDKSPWDDTASLKWSNAPASTASLSALYPSTQAKLTTGAYFWWVAAVSFDAQGHAQGFSFSDPKKFLVP